MKALYHDELCSVTGDSNGNGVDLIPVSTSDDSDIFYVDFSDPDLILDPTDKQVEDAKTRNLSIVGWVDVQSSPEA